MQTSIIKRQKMTNASTGKDNFIKKYDLWDTSQINAAKEVIKKIKSLDLDVLRISFPDQHGILRGKTIMASEVLSAFLSLIHI